MDDEWRDWDVVENVRSTKIPGFMIPPGLGLEAGKELIQDEWREFVELFNEGAGYERLLTLREHMEARKEKISEEVEKWEDREAWLGQLKGKYIQELEERAGAVHTVLWKTHEARDPIPQLDSAVLPLVDCPIVEDFVDFGDDGRLREWPDLRDGWLISTGTGLQSPRDDTGNVLQSFGYAPEDVNARRKNTTVRYRLSIGELERAGIDPDNLESPRYAIDMTPSTTWREALLQIEEKEQSVREEKGRPKRTIRVLDFRLRILENVLYRFETFGYVSALTEAEAAQAASELTPTAEDILEEFGETGLEVCDSWDMKKHLKEWALANVEPTPSPKTVERRLEEIGVWVKGRQGRDGSGLEATIQNMKDRIGAD